ncbi:hypothetical protein SEUCBS140593_008311 [Sporothrix eucalyptigena]|uniref:Zn(2)-C6 fungal-type domain-containing protein n=1 Tax=Sporothrix eucalyptigena TaxID=1812306 RepID=A0ABP0CL35_9PEZI
MTKTTSPPAAASPSVKRSVWGCLTCRRRKVKCQSRDTPCASCRRLQLECVPSFGGNFKQWRRRATQDSSQVEVVQTPLPTPTVPTETMNAFLSLSEGSPAWELDMPFLYGGAAPTTLTPGDVYTPALFSERSLTVDNSTPFAWDNSHLDYLALPSPLAHPVSAYSPDLDSDTDRSLVVYYKRNLASFFSVKAAFSSSATATSSPWNFYAYAIRAAEHQPDSPLRHSILAWASAHLLLRSHSAKSNEPALDLDHALQVRHYAKARAAADDLQRDLHGSHHGKEVAVVAPGHLRMLLATTLFLAYGDILSGDSARLVQALTGVAQLLASDWPRFRAALGPVEARILVWLAYLDLRSTMWTPSGGRKGGLFRFLQDHVGGPSSSGISALRGHSPRDYYLAECFGAALPAQELQEDLMQEPAKRLSDEIMGVYAAIADLEVWVDATGSTENAVTSDSTAVTAGYSMAPFGDDTGDDLTELRAAKIHALRATIVRIRAEAKVVHARLLRASTGADHVARTAFHRRVTDAMGHAATILLNRVDNPLVRTDDEAQSAARTIIQIARELRQGGCTASGDAYGSPRSLVWPMPVFVAGIEVTDPVYQDWVLAYLEDVAGWGTSTRRARELLRRVIEKQDAEGRRVAVREALQEMGDLVLI